jgi:hypothetical protein
MSVTIRDATYKINNYFRSATYRFGVNCCCVKEEPSRCSLGKKGRQGACGKAHPRAASGVGSKGGSSAMGKEALGGQFSEQVADVTAQMRLL